MKIVKGFVALLALAPAWAQAGPAMASKWPVAGIVIMIRGKPTLQRESAQPRPLKRNEYVYDGDTIRTGKSDRASIALTGGAEVRMAGDSTFLMESGGSGMKPASLRMDWGKLWSRLIGRAHTGLNVQTNAAVAAVRGTEADVEAQNRTTVKVYDGFVDVFNDRGRQSLTAGQTTQVADAQTAPETPRTMRPEEYETWQNSLQGKGIERQLERLQKEAQKYKELELETKDGKKIKLKLQKK